MKEWVFKYTFMINPGVSYIHYYFKYYNIGAKDILTDINFTM